MFYLRRSACLAIVLGLGASPAWAGVWVVGGAQSTHADVTSALASSVDGDVILVRDPAVAGFVIDGKSVSVVGDAPALVQLSSPVEIKNVSAGGTAALAHFACSTDVSGALFYVHDNAGSVRVQDCQFLSPLGPFVNVTSGARCENNADVAFVRTELRGGSYFTLFGTVGGPGARVSNSSAAFYDCNLLGGNGSSGYWPSGGFPQSGGGGRPGLYGANSTIFLSGSTSTGGTGGQGLSAGLPPPQCFSPYVYPTMGGPGGPAIELWSGGLARVRDSALVGGTGGVGGVDPCNNAAGDGASGPSYVSYLGAPPNYTAIPSAARRLVAPALARVSMAAPLSFYGIPGDRVYLLSKANAAHNWHASLGATLLVQSPFRRNFLGLVPIGGRLDVLLPIPALPAGVLEDHRHLQCVLVDAGGVGHGGSNALLTLLDPSY